MNARTVLVAAVSGLALVAVGFVKLAVGSAPDDGAGGADTSASPTTRAAWIPAGARAPEQVEPSQRSAVRLARDREVEQARFLLRGFQTEMDRTSPHDLAKEARLAAQVVRSECVVRAVERDQFCLIAEGTAPPDVAGAQVVIAPGPRIGKAPTVLVCILWDSDHPDLAEAERREHRAQWQLEKSRVDAFNTLLPEERQARIEQHASVQAQLDGLAARHAAGEIDAGQLRAERERLESLQPRLPGRISNKDPYLLEPSEPEPEVR